MAGLRVRGTAWRWRGHRDPRCHAAATGIAAGLYALVSGWLKGIPPPPGRRPPSGGVAGFVGGLLNDCVGDGRPQMSLTSRAAARASCSEPTESLATPVSRFDRRRHHRVAKRNRVEVHPGSGHRGPAARRRTAAAALRTHGRSRPTNTPRARASRPAGPGDQQGRAQCHAVGRPTLHTAHERGVGSTARTRDTGGREQRERPGAKAMGTTGRL